MRSREATTTIAFHAICTHIFSTYTLLAGSSRSCNTRKWSRSRVSVFLSFSKSVSSFGLLTGHYASIKKSDALAFRHVFSAKLNSVLCNRWSESELVDDDVCYFVKQVCMLFPSDQTLSQWLSFHRTCEPLLVYTARSTEMWALGSIWSLIE